MVFFSFFKYIYEVEKLFSTIKIMSIDIAMSMRKHIVSTKGELYDEDSLKLMRQNREISPFVFKKLIALKKHGLVASSLKSLAINIYRQLLLNLRRVI